MDQFTKDKSVKVSPNVLQQFDKKYRLKEIHTYLVNAWGKWIERDRGRRVSIESHILSRSRFSSTIPTLPIDQRSYHASTTIRIPTAKTLQSLPTYRSRRNLQYSLPVSFCCSYFIIETILYSDLFFLNLFNYKPLVTPIQVVSLDKKMRRKIRG